MIRISTKRILSIGLSIVFLIGAVVVYSTLIRSEMETIDDKRVEIASKTILYNNQKNAVNQVSELIAKYKGVSELQRSVSLAVPAGENTIGALRQIEAISRLSGVKISSLSFKVSVPRLDAKSFAKKMGILDIMIGASGSYETLKNLLRLLETSVRVANVKTFAFKPGIPEPGSRVVAPSDTLSISVEMYYQAL
ncbi:MAG: hypothetical protein QMD50_03285 [Patescibacteria group bacterium]|nr:hypothetical protein [Patescibacteria group bacterium]